MSSLEAIGYRVTCCAWDCEPERFAPTTAPITLQGNRAEVTAQLQRLGWAPATGRDYWWCPTHATLSAPRETQPLNG